MRLFVGTSFKITPTKLLAVAGVALAVLMKTGVVHAAEIVNVDDVGGGIITLACDGYEPLNADGYCSLQARTSTTFDDSNSNTLTACGVGVLDDDCSINWNADDSVCSDPPSDPFWIRGRLDDENASGVTLAWSDHIYRVDCDSPAVYTLEGEEGPNCGDSSIDEGEECDDGNEDDADGCSSVCEVEDGWSCEGEPSECSLIPVDCGNDELDEGESCDDGGTVDDDGCSSACEVEDGFECTGEPSECSLVPTIPEPSVTQDVFTILANAAAAYLVGKIALSWW